MADIQAERDVPMPIDTTVRASLAVQEFRQGFFGHYEALEHYIMSEMQKLEGVIVDLQEENLGLKSQCSINAQQGDQKASMAVEREPATYKSSFTSEATEDRERRLQCGKEYEDLNNGDQWAMQVKERTVRTMISRASSVHLLYKPDGIASRIVKSGVFENVTLLAVTMNAVWIGVDIDYNKKPLKEADIGFQIGELIFCAAFTLEILLRFAAFKRKISGFCDGWFVFDSLITALMWVDIMVSLAFESSGGGIISVFRLLRLARLTRVTKLATMLPELMTLIKGIVAGIRSVSIAVAVLIGITYTFALLMRTMSFDTGAEVVFSSVPHAMYILLQQGMGPDNAALMDELGRYRWYLAFVFAAFLFLSAITIMNMLIGILCEVMGTVTATEREASDLAQVSEKLQTILKEVDKNYDNNVSRQEFQSMLDYPTTLSILQSVGIDVYALVDDVDAIFENGSERTLDFNKFLEVILSFRPTTSAVIRSISAMRRNMRSNAVIVNKRLDNLELNVQMCVKQGQAASQVRAESHGTEASATPPAARPKEMLQPYYITV